MSPLQLTDRTPYLPTFLPTYLGVVDDFQAKARNFAIVDDATVLVRDFELEESASQAPRVWRHE